MPLRRGAMFSRHITIAAVGIATLFAIPFFRSSKEVWPTFPVPPGTQERMEKRAEERLKAPVKFEDRLKRHTAFGDYLNYGVSKCKENEKSRKDEAGVMRKDMGGEFHYHPVLAAQCGLMAYGGYLRNGVDEGETVLYADNLISLQTEDGAYRYPFAYNYYLTKKDLPAGWTSAMAQGQAMSLMARAFIKTGDRKYIDSGTRALDYLLTPVDQGGVMTTLSDLHPSLSRYVFFEEYVSEPANYTLNGYMFTLLGLYDWSQIDPAVDAKQDIAAQYFAKGMETLVKILPYYDMGELTAYDLGYITFAPVVPNMPNRYHGVHIYLLHALHSVTQDARLKSFEAKWAGYLDR